MSKRFRQRGQFYRYVVASRPPFGLVSLRYLAPGLSEQQRVHRRLLAMGVPGAPRYVVVALNAWHWVRWVGFLAWRSSIRAVKRRGPAVRDQHGTRLVSQLVDVLRLALTHTVSPVEYYRLELYRPERQREMWAYVYTVEVAAFHRWRNREIPDSLSDAAAARLSNKRELVEALALRSVPTAVTLANLAEGATSAALSTLGGDVLFCKPRVGSGARGVFRSQWNGAELTVWRLDGERVEPADVEGFVDERFASADYLIQPYVSTHPALAHLGSAATEALTVRVITEITDGDVVVTCAYLEIPVDIDDRHSYAPVPADVRTGIVGTVNGRFGATRDDYSIVTSNLESEAEGLVVPQWGDLMNAAHTAHRYIPDLYAIAWDFIVGPDGPVLLEGNSAWATAVPQLLNGPLLASVVEQ